MGLFVSEKVNAVPVTAGLEAAYRSEALSPPEAASRASTEGGDLAQATRGEKEYHFGRILVAFALFFVLLGVSILCDANDWVDDPKVLYGMATTVLGIIVGFLGGEASSGPSN
jgi:hypothetical protein